MSARAAGSGAGPLVLLLAALALTGCGAAQTVVVTHHELRLREDEYRILPRSVSVPPGRLKVVVSNDGVLAHDLVIEHHGVIVRGGTIPTILPGHIGGPIKIAAADLPPGEYELLSGLSNQANLGMIATLIVRPY